MTWATRPRLVRRGRSLSGLAAIALFLGCRRTPPDPPPAATPDAAPAAAGPVAKVDGGLAAARCKLGERGATLREIGDRRSLEVGEGVAAPGGVAVGVLHTPAAGPEAVIARVVGGNVAEEWVVAKRGELVPDAPPPKPLVAGSALYAAYVARGAPGDAAGPSRRIVIRKSGVAAPVATYPERADESLGFDASLNADGSRAAVVWDDDAVAAGPKGGGITVAIAPLLGGQTLAPRVVSGDTADPDGPRVGPRENGGWWVAWMAHRPEDSGDGGARTGAAALAEAPAEERLFSWIEIVALGDDGAPAGPPRRITSATGHAASFDLGPRSRGGVDLVVRDETQVREGEGGRILHLAVSAEGAAEEAAVLVPSGVGRGSVDLVTGPGSEAWLAFSDAQDRTVVLPLGPARAALGPPSVEDSLEGGRLLSLESGGASARFVAAFPGGEGALFREVGCAP